MAAYTFLRSEVFDEWLLKLKDERARARIAARMISAELGNLGDCVSVGEGVIEMRIHFGPDYRAYFVQRGEIVFLLLLGGDKRSQKRDIAKAKALAKKIGDFPR